MVRREMLKLVHLFLRKVVPTFGTTRGHTDMRKAGRALSAASLVTGVVTKSTSNILGLTERTVVVMET
jgi:hypothetical protein